MSVKGMTHAGTHVRTHTVSEDIYNKLMNDSREYQALLNILPAELISKLKKAARYYSQMKDTNDSFHAQIAKIETFMEQVKEENTTIVSSFIYGMGLPFSPDAE